MPRHVPWITLCALASATGLCALGLVDAVVWLEATRWVFVSFMAAQALSGIPWRAQFPELEQFPDPGIPALIGRTLPNSPLPDPLYQGIFARGFGGDGLPEFADPELRARDYKIRFGGVPFPPPMDDMESEVEVECPTEFDAKVSAEFDAKGIPTWKADHARQRLPVQPRRGFFSRLFRRRR